MLEGVSLVSSVLLIVGKSLFGISADILLKIFIDIILLAAL